MLNDKYLLGKQAPLKVKNAFKQLHVLLESSPKQCELPLKHSSLVLQLLYNGFSEIFNNYIKICILARFSMKIVREYQKFNFKFKKVNITI